MLTPENLGEMVFEVVSMTVPALLNPKMTASWEKGLDGITRGTVDFWDYRTKLEVFIRTETEKMIGQDLREPLAERISNFAGTVMLTTSNTISPRFSGVSTCVRLFRLR